MSFSAIRENARMYRKWRDADYTPEGEQAIDADALERIDAMSKEQLARIVIEIERYRRDLFYAAKLRDHHASLAKRDGRPSTAGLEARIMRQAESDINDILYG